jgi:phosphoribosylaminoimidazole-succinocarboxamide synthase
MKLNSRIIIEGPNGVGKTTIAKMLADYFKVKHYSPYFGTRNLYDQWFKNPEEALKTVKSILANLPHTGIFDRYHLTPQTMVNRPLDFLPFINTMDLIVLLDSEPVTLKNRLVQRGSAEDIDATGYFRVHYNRLADNWNALYIKTDDIPPDKIIEIIIHRYNQIINKEIFQIKEGKSKIIFQKENQIIVSLKPTLTSYTYNKHIEVEGTDVLRNSIFEIFTNELKKNNIAIIDSKRINDRQYSSEFCFAFPFEVIVKDRATGTTTINCPGLFCDNVPFFSTVVRFDYRCEPNDIPVPSDYVRNYGIDTDFIKNNSLKAFNVLKRLLLSIGYELVDLCFIYGFDINGNIKIISEISPDGMRIRKNGESFDKDLFRHGFGNEVILKKWSELLNDLRGW